MNKKVLLGMSGGVDSSVAAILLKEQGYEVIGATMKLWDSKIVGGCTSSTAIDDAKKVCKTLNIPHYTLDYKKEFKQYVIDDFMNCYANCKTPNPCIECNKHLKFDYFYQKALELGCDYISTGHYAKVEYNDMYNQFVLKKSDSIKKDQTYFLYSIKKEVLDHMLFPLQNFTDKKEIREIAEKYGLKIAKKPDSQEICFIPDNDYTKFLKNNLKQTSEPGNIVNKNGEILGKHNGLINYTIGQRKGMGISYKEPLYVLQLDKEKNEVLVGTEEELYSKELYATNLNYLISPITSKIKVMAKIRYRAKEALATVIPIDENNVKLEFDEPQRAITPGQSVVFYLDDIVLGGGKIK